MIGPPISWIANKILTALGNTVTVKDLEKSVKTSYAKRNETYEDVVLKSVDQDRNMLEKVVNTTVSVIKFPFKFLFVIAFLLLVGFLYLLH